MKLQNQAGHGLSFQKSFSQRALFVLTSLAALTCGISARAGSIIVDNDEWTLSDSGFGVAGSVNTTNYAVNAANFLTGGSGSILIYSSNFGLSGGALHTALTGAGYSVTEDGSLSTTFTAANLFANYRAVFLAGNTLPSADSAVLTQYVNDGGGVYIAAGTGGISGGSAGEANQWNAFLNGFGLNLDPNFNGITGNIAVSGASPILAGVSQLYYNNGNSVNVLGGFPNASIIATDAAVNNAGLIGAYSSPSSSPSVPDEASTIGLAGIAALALTVGLRAKRNYSKAA